MFIIGLYFIRFLFKINFSKYHVYSLVIRLLPQPTEKVRWTMCDKFGCKADDVPKLLSIAQELELKVVGVR